MRRPRGGAPTARNAPELFGGPHADRIRKLPPRDCYLVLMDGFGLLNRRGMRRRACGAYSSGSDLGWAG
ncbi:hypothetical protein GCM10010169_49100 [Micromonospora fulviviridis]|nr:hypothetical protein GCM10010169_49100 [Micromonospora fulviviridis]